MTIYASRIWSLAQVIVPVAVILQTALCFSFLTSINLVFVKVKQSEISEFRGNNWIINLCERLLDPI
jgi:hypothetical protein